MTITTRSQLDIYSINIELARMRRAFGMPPRCRVCGDSHRKHRGGDKSFSAFCTDACHDAAES